jgi:hypothetical protein
MVAEVLPYLSLQRLAVEKATIVHEGSRSEEIVHLKRWTTLFSNPFRSGVVAVLTQRACAALEWPSVPPFREAILESEPIDAIEYALDPLEEVVLTLPGELGTEVQVASEDDPSFEALVTQDWADLRERTMHRIIANVVKESIDAYACDVTNIRDDDRSGGPGARPGVL